jgi:hypothetical protein
MRASQRLAVLVVGHGRVPQPDMHAGDRRLVAVLEMMAPRYDVDLYVGERLNTTGGVDPQPYVERLEQIGIRLLPPCGIERALARAAYDVAFVESWRHVQMYAGPWRAWQPWGRLIADSVDVEFARLAGAVKLGLMDASAADTLRCQELAAYRAADAVVVVTDDDRLALAAEPGMPPLSVLPLVLPIRPRAAGERARELLFVGGFAFHPNSDGVTWFVREIWPLIRAAVPDTVFTAVGSNPTPEVIALGDVPGVRVLGYVPDTNPYLDRAALSVAPLRYGGGMKGKVIEAMASGVPVVTTSAGAQGLGAVSGQHLVIADTAEEYAAAAVGLLTDPPRGKAMGLAGQQLAASLCGPQAVQPHLTGMIERLAAEVPNRRLRLARRLRQLGVDAGWYSACAALGGPGARLANVVPYWVQNGTRRTIRHASAVLWGATLGRRRPG